MKDRLEVARVCHDKLGHTFPIIVDGIDNKVGQAYAAWPDRLYIVDKNGKIAYKGGKGPRGFKPSEMAEKLKKLCSS